MNAQVRKAKSPMSSDQDISSLIADPHSDLSAFKPLLQIAPAWRNNEEKEEFLKLHVQMKELRARISQSLTPSEEAETGEQQEIVSYVDTLKRSSMIFFILGQYKECYEALTLLVEIEPENPAAQHFLEITQRTLREGQGDNDTRKHKVDSERELETTHSIALPTPGSMESEVATNAKTRPWKHWLVMACAGIILIGVLAGVLEPIEAHRENGALP